MATRSQDSKRSPREVWVPSGIGSAGVEGLAPDDEGGAEDVGEWLPDGKPPRQTSPQKRRKLPKRGTSRERWLLGRLRRSQQRLEEHKREIDELKRRLGEAKAESTGTDGRDRGDGRPGAKLDLNEASLDQLRGLGLNAAQAARLLAYRQRAEGFDSIEEVAQIPGFGPATLKKLRSRAFADDSLRSWKK